MIKIRMVDNVCYGNWHLNFNTQLIQILSNISTKVEYRGVQDLGSQIDNVHKKKTIVITGSGRLSIIFRFFFNIINDVWQLIITPKDELIVYSFDSTVSIHILNSLNKILDKRVIMFRHGSMEMLINSAKGKGIIYQFESYLIRNFFFSQSTRVCKNLHFFVLGDVIIKNLSSYLTKEKMASIHSIDLPFRFENINLPKTIRKDSINIGTVGVFNENKGGNTLVELYNLLEQNKTAKINFSITGKIDYDLKILESKKINLPFNKGISMVSQEEMKERIRDLDFILFLYPSDTYRLTASGALFESINYERPIIAIKNEYFEYFFNKFGSIGYLFDTLEEMSDFLNNMTVDNYNKSDFNFAKVRSKLDLEFSTDEFLRQLYDLKLINNPKHESSSFRK